MKTKDQNSWIITFHNNEFGNVRIITDNNGEPLFVGKDVATALGYTNPQKAIRDHVDEEDRPQVQYTEIQGVNETFTPSAAKTNIVVINESGLYSLIFASKLPSAKEFKRWVTSEVLPQIRRTGGYIPTRDLNTGEPLTEAQIVRCAEHIMLNTISSVNKIADGCVTTSEIAKSLGVDVKDINRQLVKYGVLYWNGSRYKLDEDYAGIGLTQDRNFHYFALDGTKKERSYLVWTTVGVEFVRNVMLNA